MSSLRDERAVKSNCEAGPRREGEKREVKITFKYYYKLN
jgi:hypothetical protein